MKKEQKSAYYTEGTEYNNESPEIKTESTLLTVESGFLMEIDCACTQILWKNLKMIKATRRGKKNKLRRVDLK